LRLTARFIKLQFFRTASHSLSHANAFAGAPLKKKDNKMFDVRNGRKTHFRNYAAGFLIVVASFMVLLFDFVRWLYRCVWHNIYHNPSAPSRIFLSFVSAAKRRFYYAA